MKLVSQIFEDLVSGYVHQAHTVIETELVQARYMWDKKGQRAAMGLPPKHAARRLIAQAKRQHHANLRKVIRRGGNKLLSLAHKVAQEELGATKGKKAKKFYRAIHHDKAFEHFQDVGVQAGLKRVAKTMISIRVKLLNKKPWLAHNGAAPTMQAVQASASWMWSKPKATKRYKRKKSSQMSAARLQTKVASLMVKLAHKVALQKVGPLPRHTGKTHKARLTKKQRKYGLAAKGTLTKLMSHTTHADFLKGREVMIATRLISPVFEGLVKGYVNEALQHATF